MKFITDFKEAVGETIESISSFKDGEFLLIKLKNRSCLLLEASSLDYGDYASIDINSHPSSEDLVFLDLMTKCEYDIQKRRQETEDKKKKEEEFIKAKQNFLEKIENRYSDAISCEDIMRLIKNLPPDYQKCSNCGGKGLCFHPDRSGEEINYTVSECLCGADLPDIGHTIDRS